MLRCKNCRERFIPRYNNSLQKYCMEKDECIKAFTDNHKVTKEKIDAKGWAKEKKERKEAIMSHSEWLKILQAVFNSYIRERDKDLGCISCQTFNGQMHCGHYRAVSVAPQLRFNEDNCSKQCSRCNNFLSANLINYRIALVKKIGLERVENLENDNSVLKISVEEIKEKIKIYKEKTKELISKR